MSELVASTESTTATPAAPSIAETIEAWFVARIHNSPVSQDTRTYNHVRAAVDELKALLAPEPAPADGEG